MGEDVIGGHDFLVIIKVGNPMIKARVVPVSYLARRVAE
jgi:hypothetical protein